MKKTIDVLVGISASGKSTYSGATLRDHPEGKTLNADSIREELYGDPQIQGDGMEVFGKLFDRYTQMLKDDVTDYIIIDNTSLTPKLRKRYIDLTETICPMFGHEFEVRLLFFKPDLKRSLAWNKKRERNVPEDVIERQVSKWQHASESERSRCTILDVELGTR